MLLVTAELFDINNKIKRTRDSFKKYIKFCNYNHKAR